MQYGEESQSNSGGFRERRGGRFGNRGFSPVKVGEELDVTIEAVGEKGDGIAKKNGFVIFVPGVRQGDSVKIRITKVFRKMAFAEVIGEAQPSEAGEAAEEAEEPEEEVADSVEDSEEF